MQSGICYMKLRSAALSTFCLKQEFVWKAGQIAEALAVFCFAFQ